MVGIRGGESCAIARTVDVLRDPWSFLVLREALGGVTRFAEFRARLGIASDVLTDRLSVLVGAGVLQRRRYQDEGARPREEYLLTAAGRDLSTVIGALQQWGDRYLPYAPGPTVVRRRAGTDEPVEVAFVDRHGRRVDAEDVAFERTATYPDSAGHGARRRGGG